MFFFYCTTVKTIYCSPTIWLAVRFQYFFQDLKSFFTRQKQTNKQTNKRKTEEVLFRAILLLIWLIVIPSRVIRLYKQYSYMKFAMYEKWRTGRLKSFNWDTSLFILENTTQMQRIYTCKTTVRCIIYLGLMGKLVSIHEMILLISCGHVLITYYPFLFI